MTIHGVTPGTALETIPLVEQPCLQRCFKKGLDLNIPDKSVVSLLQIGSHIQPAWGSQHSGAHDAEHDKSSLARQSITEMLGQAGHGQVKNGVSTLAQGSTHGNLGKSKATMLTKAFTIAACGNAALFLLFYFLMVSNPLLDYSPRPHKSKHDQACRTSESCDEDVEGATVQQEGPAFAQDQLMPVDADDVCTDESHDEHGKTQKGPLHKSSSISSRSTSSSFRSFVGEKDLPESAAGSNRQHLVVNGQHRTVGPHKNRQLAVSTLRVPALASTEGEPSPRALPDPAGETSFRIEEARQHLDESGNQSSERLTSPFSRAAYGSPSPPTPRSSAGDSDSSFKVFGPPPRLLRIRTEGPDFFIRPADHLSTEHFWIGGDSDDAAEDPPPRTLAHAAQNEGEMRSIEFYFIGDATRDLSLTPSPASAGSGSHLPHLSRHFSGSRIRACSAPASRRTGRLLHTRNSRSSTCLRGPHSVLPD